MSTSTHVKTLFALFNGALLTSSIQLGRELGLFAMLKTSFPAYITPAALAGALHMNERVVREWCAQLAAAQLLEWMQDDTNDSGLLLYRCPEIVSRLLIDTTSPQYVGAFADAAVLWVHDRDRLRALFRQGKGFAFGDNVRFPKILRPACSLIFCDDAARSTGSPSRA